MYSGELVCAGILLLHPTPAAQSSFAFVRPMPTVERTFKSMAAGEAWVSEIVVRVPATSVPVTPTYETFTAADVAVLEALEGVHGEDDIDYDSLFDYDA